jgi:hypothetical protein
MDCWPAYSAETKRELEKIRDTHRAMPLPVFTRSMNPRKSKGVPSPSDWTLVKPEQYNTVLLDSPMLATFHLVHFAFGNKDYWNAVPQSIRLLTHKLVVPTDVGFSPLNFGNADLILGSPSNLTSTPKASSSKRQKVPSTPKASSSKREKDPSPAEDDTPSKKKTRK